MAIQTLSKSRQFWLDHIRQCEAEKMMPTEYCKKHNLVKQRFYNYKSDLRKQGFQFACDKPANSFVAVKPLENQVEVKSPIAHSLSGVNLNLTIKSRLVQLQLNVGQSS